MSGDTQTWTWIASVLALLALAGYVLSAVGDSRTAAATSASCFGDCGMLGPAFRDSLGAALALAAAWVLTGLSAVAGLIALALWNDDRRG
jgi:class 3 adenylate cyclase